MRRASASSSAGVRRRVRAIRWRKIPRPSPSSRPSWVGGEAVGMPCRIRHVAQGILFRTYTAVKRPRPPPGGARENPRKRALFNYLIDVQGSSHRAFETEATPLTLADSMSTSLSQIHTTAGACSMIILSMSAHACARCSLGSSSALSMALLTAGTSSCGQLELPCSRMFLPLNVGSRIVWGSEKSFSQPTFGQIATFAAGELQYFVYIVWCWTWRRTMLKPMFLSCSAATWAVLAPTPVLSPTMRIFSLPSYLPDWKPAALKYLVMASGRGEPSSDT